MKYNDLNPPLICMQTNSTCYKQTKLMTVKGVLWHSTGANNPCLGRYIQPLKTDSNYQEMATLLGPNSYNNDYNHATYNSGLNAWIGKTAAGEVVAIQSMPWTYRPWGCGSGRSGSCNNGWIQFECAEDSLADIDYFNKIYKEACELTAYLCKKFQLNPLGYTICNGVKTPVILCHQDSYQLGLGSNHGDIYNWFNKYGKTMDDVRKDVFTLMQETEVKEEEIMTQEQFNEMMNVWIAETANEAPGSWSANARYWAEQKGLIKGDERGRKLYRKVLTREEFITVLARVFSLDDSYVEDWSKEARDWAIEKGLINGDGNKNGWAEYVTKEQLVTILYRLKEEK